MQFKIQHSTSKIPTQSYQHDLDKKISQSIYFILRLKVVLKQQ